MVLCRNLGEFRRPFRTNDDAGLLPATVWLANFRSRFATKEWFLQSTGWLPLQGAPIYVSPSVSLFPVTCATAKFSASGRIENGDDWQEQGDDNAPYHNSEEDDHNRLQQ